MRGWKNPGREGGGNHWRAMKEDSGRRGFAALIVAVAICITAVVFLLGRSEVESAAAGPDGQASLRGMPGKVTAAAGGVGARPYDLASAACVPDSDAWMAPGRQDLRAYLSETMPLDELDDRVLKRNEEWWEPTRVWLTDGGGGELLGAARLKCSITHLRGTEFETCRVKWQLVVERDDDRVGTIRYARVDPDFETVEQCRAYGDCVAREGWLGRVGPLPSLADKVLALETAELIQKMEGSESERIEYLRREIDALWRSLEAFREAGLHDLVTYHEKKIRELEGLLEALDK